MVVWINARTKEPEEVFTPEIDRPEATVIAVIATELLITYLENPFLWHLDEEPGYGFGV